MLLKCQKIYRYIAIKRMKTKQTKEEDRQRDEKQYSNSIINIHLFDENYNGDNNIFPTFLDLYTYMEIFHVHYITLMHFATLFSRTQAMPSGIHRPFQRSFVVAFLRQFLFDVHLLVDTWFVSFLSRTIQNIPAD